MKNQMAPIDPTSPSQSQRRQIENEVVFRKANEKVQIDLSKLRKLAEANGDVALVPSDDLVLHFYCECSDENCRQRIELSLSKYKKLHQDRKQFIICPNHEAVSIEKVVASNAKFSVVEKFFNPPETAASLNTTPINNT